MKRATLPMLVAHMSDTNQKVNVLCTCTYTVTSDKLATLAPAERRQFERFLVVNVSISTVPTQAQYVGGLTCHANSVQHAGLKAA